MTTMTFLMQSFFVLFFSFLTIDVHAYSPHYALNWTVSFSERSLLGTSKQVILVNGEFPGPLLNTTTSDVLSINIHNNLTEPFLMTWNGVQLRKNSWQDGVRGTNCPIMPGQNWTYNFMIKDQIGSFFYYPSLLLQKAAGGYGAIRINNRPDIPVPFTNVYGEYDVLIGDWYNSDYRELRALLDKGSDELSTPDGILINGSGPNVSTFDFVPGKTYRLRISNVGLKTSLNFRIQNHKMLLVETEGAYTIKQTYDSLDVHVGQSYSVLVTAHNTTTYPNATSYFMVASSRYLPNELSGLGVIRYNSSSDAPLSPPPPGPLVDDYDFSAHQSMSQRLDPVTGAARPNPQGSYHYGNITINQTLVLRNDVAVINGTLRYTVNGISFNYPDTVLKLADYYQISGVFGRALANKSLPRLDVHVIDIVYHDFVHIVFQNPLETIQTWHSDGYNFFVVRMGFGLWNESDMATYNMVNAISRSTVEVYPMSWTAVLVKMENQGLWNFRSQDAEKAYLGQEVYLRVKGVGQDDPSKISPRDEEPIPHNVLKCGKLPKKMA